MCGIAGLLGSDAGPSAEAQVRRMVTAMHSRGPNDHGVWSSPEHGIMLGNTRLAIVDLSQAGHMPMSDASGRCWITYNGELYNHRALRKELNGGGYVFRSGSDTEVVLAAYLRWGRDCLPRLRGMFAFAVADLRASLPLVLLARDRLGIKPLYWSRTSRGFVFASEIKALLASGLVEPVADHQSVLDYLSLGSVAAPRTILRDVVSLLPGHALAVHGSEPEEWRYWRPGRSTEAVPSTMPEAASALRAILAETVADHMEADVPVGAFLSGGIDSAGLVALASGMTGRPLQTFTVRFGEGPSALAEVGRARAVAERFRTSHTEVAVSAAEVAANFAEIVRVMDQPSIDGVNSYFVSKAASSGVSVALSGLGADELMAGYPHFERFRRVSRVLPQGSAVLRPVATVASRFLPGRVTRPLEFAAATPAQRHAQLRRPLTAPTRRRLLHPANFPSIAGALGPELIGVPGGREEPIFAASVAELSGYLPNTLLRDVDAMSMAHSLEVRVPYLDHRLVEFALALRPELKLGGGVGKLVLREALADLLPPGTLLPGKSYFSMPLEAWVAGPLLDPVIAALRSGVANRLFDATEVMAIQAAAERGRGAAAWSAAVLSAWLDNHRVAL